MSYQFTLRMSVNPTVEIRKLVSAYVKRGNVSPSPFNKTLHEQGTWMLFAEMIEPGRDNDDLGYDDAGSEPRERATHNMHYYLVVIFHADVEKRPCRPILRVVHLTTPPALVRADIIKQRGVEMLVTCQLCDTAVKTRGELGIDPFKLLCVYTLSITDTEASTLIGNIAEVNTHVASSGMSLSHRSNIALLPRVMHRMVSSSLRSIFHLRLASTATDVQLSVLLLRESLNTKRSVSVKLHALHPYLSTPEHLFESLASCMRPLDLFAFRSGPHTGTRNPEPVSVTRNRNPEPGNRNPEPGTLPPGTRNPTPAIRNPKPGTRNPEPGTRNPEPGTRCEATGLLRNGVHITELV
ncbi:hypothetical protein T484DRAFT_1747608 [Baffinella frigidus]|nr:hypothetical protein T484DRAFT_1747608 [Cryptophyta sp. CCMP2293]